ncbi:hypothetical protein BME96_16300 [Virgibacillus halodenitrificans]|uniref:Uncharacterized protein n=1 Tax=Virgibacillus halodenitrificans TaxID=1482 RepID=A0AAC9J144_VIRHA|nr:hypothetical protein BME96_16300 [Virgibacillus halodenitrificans]
MGRLVSRIGAELTRVGALYVSGEALLVAVQPHDVSAREPAVSGEVLRVAVQRHGVSVQLHVVAGGVLCVADETQTVALHPCAVSGTPTAH